MPRGITLPLTWPEAGALGFLILLVAASWLFVNVLPRPKKGRADPMAVVLGARGLTNLATLSVTAIWLAVFIALLGGLLWTVQDLFTAVFDPAVDATDRRWRLATLAAVTTVLGAVIALPFTLRRTIFDARTTRATEEDLKTALLNKAIEGLGAEKKVDRIGRVITFRHAERDDTALEWKGTPLTLPEGAEVTRRDEWKVFSETLPNLEVRIGAVLALERLSQQNDDLHVQIMQILCAYIRENSPASGAVKMPEMGLYEEGYKRYRFKLLPDWEEGLALYQTQLDATVKTIPPLRVDIQMALTVIGRRDDSRRLIEAQWGYPPDDAPSHDPLHVSLIPVPPKTKWSATAKDWLGFNAKLKEWAKSVEAHRGYRIDLRKTNLQGADLQAANLAGAKLAGAQMQRAELRDAQTQSANLGGAQMQRANLRRAQMQSADLWDAQMQSARLGGAQMQSAILWHARMQGADLCDAQMQSARLGGAQMQSADLAGAQMQSADLGGAQMQSADLWYAQMQSANLLNADVDLANLVGANLTDPTGLSRKALSRSFGDATTRLPDGITPADPRWPAHWPKIALTRPRDEYRKWRADPAAYDPTAAEGEPVPPR